LSGTIQTRISAAALLAANLVPFWGALFWGWPLEKLLAIYWAESGVIGVFNVFKMLLIAPLGGLFLGAFFTVHFGGFMVVHGMFLSAMFTPGGAGFGPSALLGMVAGVRWELFALAASHGVSFLVYWIFGNDRRNGSLHRQMFAPYARIVVMHISILFGGFAVWFLGQPTWMLALFVALKTGVDLAAHLREHRASRRVGGVLPSGASR
jgi:hypothetical protein